MKGVHQLYPIIEIVIGVPLGMGNSVYTLPEVPTIGFVRGRTSSSTGSRAISTATGSILKISYGGNQWIRHLEIRRMIPTNLRNGHQIWHGLKVVGREISITSRLDLRQGLDDLCPESLLAIPVLGQLPESKGQLANL